MKKALEERLDHLEAGRELAVLDAPRAPEVLVSSLPDRESTDAALKEHVAQLQMRTLAILERAESVGRADLVLKCIREARGNLELLARLTGQFDRPPGSGHITAVVVLPRVDITCDPPVAVAIEVRR